MTFLAAADLGASVDILWSKLSAWTVGFIAMVPNLLLAALIIALGVVLSGIASRFLARILTRALHNESLARLLASLARVAFIALAMLGSLTLLHLDKTVTSLLAGVGVIGLALGFAFQDIAANFMAGFLMAAQRPFAPGDTVELAGKKCKVIRVELRATHAETLDGLSIMVPNKDVYQQPIINYSKTEFRRMELILGTGYDDDLETVQKVAMAAVGDIIHRDPEREPELFFTSFGDSSIQSQLRVWLLASSELALIQARSDAIIRIKKAFDGAGISIPFPIRTLDFGDALGGEQIDPRRFTKERRQEATSAAPSTPGSTAERGLVS